MVYGEQIDRMIADFEKLVNDSLAAYQPKEILITAAFWQQDTIRPADVKPHCFFIEGVYLANKDIGKKSLGDFIEGAGGEFELQFTGLPSIPARGYEGGTYTYDGKQYFGFWLSISDEDYEKMEPGVNYELVPRSKSEECRWLVAEDVTLTKPME